MIEGMDERGEYSYEKLARIVSRKKANLRDYRYLLFPINLKHFHWFLIAFDLS
jgi:Ulp1 family protease